MAGVQGGGLAESEGKVGHELIVRLRAPTVHGAAADLFRPAPVVRRDNLGMAGPVAAGRDVAGDKPLRPALFPTTT